MLTQQKGYFIKNLDQANISNAFVSGMSVSNFDVQIRKTLTHT